MHSHLWAGACHHAALFMTASPGLPPAWAPAPQMQTARAALREAGIPKGGTATCVIVVVGVVARWSPFRDTSKETLCVALARWGVRRGSCGTKENAPSC